MSSSVGISFPIYGNIKFMFQTTNKYIVIGLMFQTTNHIYIYRFCINMCTFISHSPGLLDIHVNKLVPSTKEQDAEPQQGAQIHKASHTRRVHATCYSSYARQWVILCWLLVYLPLWKIWKSMGRIIPYTIWETCSKPLIRTCEYNMWYIDWYCGIQFFFALRYIMINIS
jgi:hypothetical protein